MKPGFQVGDKVQRRDGTEAWAVGFVTQLEPLLVNKSDTNPSEAGCSWDEVRPFEPESEPESEPEPEPERPKRKKPRPPVEDPPEAEPEAAAEPS